MGECTGTPDQFSAYSNGEVVVLKRTLRKADKICFHSEFEYIRQHGKTLIGKLILLNVAPTPDQQLKCGVICSRKFSKLAVTRNRARRLIWESFRLSKAQIAPCHLLVIPKRTIVKSKQPEVMAELIKLLQSAQVYLPEPVSEPEC